jgi:ketosteroid isomerase-like protein
MSNLKYAVFNPVKPYFDLVRGALGDLVDGEHFFDSASDDIAYEVLYEFPGWPRVIKGKEELMESFRGYGKHIAIHAADHLTKHLTDDGQVIVIEYEVHGTILMTGVHYNNRFCSIIKIAKRRIVHWRDYMDSLAAWNALTSKAP